MGIDVSGANPGTEGSAVAARMAIVSHQDDDILFMSRDLRTQIDAGGAMTTVFLSAGDAGYIDGYWEAREQGVKAAYSDLSGSYTWVDEVAQIQIGDRMAEVATSYLEDRPEIRVYFLRLPDGPMGQGSAAQNYQSLEKLWMNEIPHMSAIDGSGDYSRNDVVHLLTGLMDRHQPETLMTQDAYSRYSSGEHSDHQYSARFSMLAHQSYETPHNIQSYIGYASRNMAQNIFGEEYDRGITTFFNYAKYDYRVINRYYEDGGFDVLGSYRNYAGRQYLVDDFDTYWSTEFSYNNGGWSSDLHVRRLADVNGDGTADLVGFGANNVMVAGSNMLGFDESRIWATDFSFRHGWRIARHERELGDVNGDGRDDIVAFGDAGTYVALSNGRGFDAPTLWIADYGRLSGGWRVDKHERLVGDVNGDGLDDVMAYGGQGLRVSLSTGTGFQTSALWSDEFIFRVANINSSRDVRELGDVNGDGRDDAVLFGDAGTYVALSNGAGFHRSSLWIADFGASTDWTVAGNPRAVADVNGDGREDLIGFGENGVLVALSNGAGFGPAEYWLDDPEFFASQWTSPRYDRQVSDVNGDGMADIVWFDDFGARVSLSTGSGFVNLSYDELTL